VGDENPVIRAAAVQAASVFLDREATTEKACRLIREAGENGARVIAFPEGFIPAHPNWFHFHPGTSPIATRLSIDLFNNAVVIPGPETEALSQAARDAGAYVVMGLCEKTAGSFGSMYNTLLFIGADGSIIGKHQKFVPTVGERLVHMPGGPETWAAVPTDFGVLSGLICGENSNPLAVFALTAEHTRVHTMSWPAHFFDAGCPMPDIALTMARAFAQMSQAFVISSAAVVDDRMREMMQVGPDGERFLARPEVSGGSAIIAPDTSILAGPLPGDREEILYADMDFELGVTLKLRHDLAGHYNRPDIFRLLVNRAPAQLLQDASAFANGLAYHRSSAATLDGSNMTQLGLPIGEEETG
jgi:aliphatic nitrilase